MPYREVYDGLFALFYDARKRKRNKRGLTSPRNGVPHDIARRYMSEIGWKWTPTMHIGSGCTVHLKDGEIPMDRALVVSVSRHLTAVVNGIIYDTHDPQRDGTRCVYGYWEKAAK